MLGQPCLRAQSSAVSSSRAPAPRLRWSFGDDQPIQFRARANFHKVRDTDVCPANDSCFGGFRNEQCVLRHGLQFAHSSCDFRGRRRITKLPAQLRQPLRIATSRAANFDALFSSSLRHLSACFLAQPFLYRIALQFAECVCCDPPRGRANLAVEFALQSGSPPR